MERPTTASHADAMPDTEVIRRVLDGHTELFAVLIRRYNQQVYRIARSYLSNEEDIKDVMQTAYLKAFEKLGQFRAEAQFSTWLIRIVINEALKAINQKKRFVSSPDAVTELADHGLKDGAKTVTPETKAMKNDMKAFLEQAIDRLPPKYRSVLVMREIEQMSTRETATCLNISRANVKVRLFRARNLLQEELKKVVDYSTLFTFKGARCDAMTERVMQEIRARSK